MATHQIRKRDKDSLTQFLGWLSVGLGTAQLLAPAALCRLVGASGRGASHRLMRLMGVRELAQGVGILTRPRPSAWLWSRVAGDGLDLSLLVLTAVKNRRARSAFVIANVLAVTVPDVLESRHLSEKQGEPQRGMLVRKAVTINRPREDVERAWVGAAELREKVLSAHAQVSFADAPGRRGTELAVEFLHAPPAGDLGAAALKVAGKDLPTQLADDLRRFKQQVETGEIIRSDSTPGGHLLTSQLRQRPAQPLEEVAR
ncbi:MAG: hypothetical protein ACJ74S_02605 [Gaiellaceae bacterium]